MLTQAWQFHLLLPPATKLGQGYIFKGVCDSVQGGVCLVLGGSAPGGCLVQGGLLQDGICSGMASALGGAWFRPPRTAKSKNRWHECLESRVTNWVYQTCDSLRTCAEAVIFPPRVHVVYFILWWKCLLRMKGNTSGMSGTGLRCTMVCIAYLETVISLRNSTARQPQAK